MNAYLLDETKLINFKTHHFVTTLLHKLVFMETNQTNKLMVIYMYHIWFMFFTCFIFGSWKQILIIIQQLSKYILQSIWMWKSIYSCITIIAYFIQIKYHWYTLYQEIVSTTLTYRCRSQNLPHSRDHIYVSNLCHNKHYLHSIYWLGSKADDLREYMLA